MSTTETIAHPKLHHYGLITARLDPMIDWYRNVLGMTINHRFEVPTPTRNRAPFSGMAFVSNDEINHRIVFFEKPEAAAAPAPVPEQRREGPLQHVAFACATFDDLLDTYARLKGLGILPVWAADHGVGTAIYYADPDQNIVELHVNNHDSEAAATEHIKTTQPTLAPVDPEKMLAARKSGASPRELHERALAGDFAPANPRLPQSRS
jgi:catechol 2,3-dioxygenase-like lactoylglutathione lyase family enzyme